MSLETMRDLLVDELQALHSAEGQIIRALPAMVEGAQTKLLRRALMEHLRQTERQVKRLDRALVMLDRSAKDGKSRGMQGLLGEIGDLLQDDGDAFVIDAGLIAAVQRIVHYEIAAYGSAMTLSKLLGYHDVAELLSLNLEEEEETDDLLSAIADAEVNLRAMEPAFAEPTA